MNLSDDNMPEAEVSIRLAASLIEQGIATSDVQVALDGAQIRIKETDHFLIRDYIAHIGWAYAEPHDTLWTGALCKAGQRFRIIVHSTSGKGDVVASMARGRMLRVESKKGPLTRSKSSKEYPLVQSAIGQLMTLRNVAATDVLAVAVPSSPKFEALAGAWRDAPLMLKAGIKILTVARSGEIGGLGDE